MEFRKVAAVGLTALACNGVLGDKSDDTDGAPVETDLLGVDTGASPADCLFHNSGGVAHAESALPLFAWQ